VAERLADELQNLSLCEVADQIKTGHVSAAETLRACFEQIDRLGSRLSRVRLARSGERFDARALALQQLCTHRHKISPLVHLVGGPEVAWVLIGRTYLTPGRRGAGNARHALRRRRRNELAIVVDRNEDADVVASLPNWGCPYRAPAQSGQATESPW
jgi:hypothetical protein